MKDDTEPENTSEPYATRPKPFLVGKSGWHRQVAALHSGGRYVPKGGFVVDFTTRGRYANEINDKWSRKSGSAKAQGDFSGKGHEEDSPGSSDNSSNNSLVVESEGSWADRIVLRHTQDILYELSPPLKSAISPAALHSQKSLDRIEENTSSPLNFSCQQKDSESNAAEKPMKHSHLPKPPHKTEKSFHEEKRGWKPPGPCTPPRGSAGNPNLHRQRSTSIPNYGKKQGGKRNSSIPSAEKPHDCATCACCAQIRQSLEETEAVCRQDKAAAAHLRRRLEQEMAKINKERRDFEAFKEEELKNIREAAEDAARKQHRDRLAEGARQRAAVKDSYLQDKAELEALKAELEAELMEAGKEAGRHRMEVERLRRKISRMELEISELSSGIKAAESDRVRAWEEAQRFKELAQHAQQDSTAWPTVSGKNCRELNGGSCSSSVLAVIGGSSPGMHSNICRYSDIDITCSESLTSCSVARENAEEERQEENENATAETENNNLDFDSQDSSCSRNKTKDHQHLILQSPSTKAAVALPSPKDAEEEEERKKNLTTPKIVRFPNGTIQRTWLDGHMATTFINGDIKQELPSGTIEYYFKEVSVWQVTHPNTGVETFYFPNGRVESHLPSSSCGVQGCKKENLLPGGAGALRTFTGSEGRQVPVKISSLRKETLLPRPMPLQSRRHYE